MEPGEESYELTGEIVAGEKYDGETANISGFPVYMVKKRGRFCPGL